MQVVAFIMLEEVLVMSPDGVWLMLLGPVAPATVAGIEGTQHLSMM